MNSQTHVYLELYIKGEIVHCTVKNAEKYLVLRNQVVLPCQNTKCPEWKMLFNDKNLHFNCQRLWAAGVNVDSVCALKKVKKS